MKTQTNSVSNKTPSKGIFFSVRQEARTFAQKIGSSTKDAKENPHKNGMRWFVPLKTK